MKKYKNLFLIISVALCLLVAMLCFAGCKGSDEETPDNLSDASVSDVQNGDNINSHSGDDNANQSDTTSGNSSKIGQNATDSNIGGTTNNTENGSKIELGQDVVIDFGDSEEDNTHTSTTSKNNTTTSIPANQNTTTSDDGWTNDYNINNKK